jgi:hypothetical protein
MFKNILFLFIFSLLITSCDKQKRTSKKIDGEWEITSYKLTDTEGLSEYAVCSGSYIFNSCENKSASCGYSCAIAFEFPSITGTAIQSGIFEVLPDGGYMDVTTINSSNIVISSYNYRILILTKTDLHLEFTDSTFKIHSLIFKKKK